MASVFGWCGDREDDEVHNIERASADTLQRFRNDFEENYKVVANGTASPIESTISSFPQMCVKSRQEKKPILALVMRDSSAACFREALSTLVQADAAIEMIV